MSRHKQLSSIPVEATIESLSHEGRGITHINGKTVFVDGALPGETVRFIYTSQRSKFAEGSTVEVITASDQRVDPACKHFSVCGGCSLQHMRPEFQIQHKQQVLLDQLKFIGGVEPEEVLLPVTGQIWGYRHKARLGVKDVTKKGKLLVGFREKRKSYIADIDECITLHPTVGKKITGLKQLISSLSIRDQVPQIEVAVGDNMTVIVIRHLAGLVDDDKKILQQFEMEHGIRILLQGNEGGSLIPLTAYNEDDLFYSIEAHKININFGALDFTQINFGINQKMIAQVMALLGPGKTENILDLFCGLGNFTLPLATCARTVTGVEGSPVLVNKAINNAARNGILNIEFRKANLYSPNIQEDFMHRDYDKVLLDPPRSGAQEVIEQMKYRNVSRLVYVSCNPATLARDAGILVNQKNFKLESAGVMDMFPHTTHVESIASFVKH